MGDMVFYSGDSLLHPGLLLRMEGEGDMVNKCKYCEPSDCFCHLLIKALAKIEAEPVVNSLPRKFDYGHPDQQRRDKQADDYLNRFVRQK